MLSAGTKLGAFEIVGQLGAGGMGDEVHGQFSPDGQWIAYASNRTGEYEIWVQPFPNPDDIRHQITNAGGAYPIWDRDGSELFYLSPDDTLMTVALEPTQSGGDFGRSAPQPIFPTEIVSNGTNLFPAGPFSTAQYAVDDLGRFLILTHAIDANGAVPPIKIIGNWLEDSR